MGNSYDGPLTRGSYSHIRAFFTSKTWIDGRASQQVDQTVRLPGVLKVAAFPDLHPGKYGPVGVAVLANRLYPHLVGNDMGCGMALFATNLKAHKLKLAKSAQALRALEGPDQTQTIADQAKGLGTIGGGNHFCELLFVDQILGETTLKRGQVLCLVHSGSRGFAAADLQDFLAADGALPLKDAKAYMTLHAAACAFAVENRATIAARAAAALRFDMELICDVPHNEVAVTDAGYVHRKGAARAAKGLVPLAGSRSTHSFVLEVADTSSSLASVSHGAGRKYDRASMHGRVGKTKSDLAALTRNSFGGHVICEDRALLKEEAAQAYKDAGQVAADLAHFGLAKPLARLQPLVTFKTAREGK